MPFLVPCPECGKKLKASDEHVGKKAKCPGCGSVVVIRKPVTPTVPSVPDDDDFTFEEPSRPLPSRPSRLPAIVVSGSSPTPIKSRRKYSIAVVAGAAVVSLLIGFFGGREQMRLQILSGVIEAREMFSKNMSKAFQTSDSQKDASSNATKPDLSSESNEANQKHEDPVVPESKPPASSPAVDTGIAMGQPYKCDLFELTLTKASIGNVPLRSTIQDAETESKDPLLMLEFTIKNPHDRKLLRVSRDNMFSPRFRLVDDVKNFIRGVDFGFATEVVGAVDPSDDIQPGESRTHLEVFSVPPPKTEFLLLTLDCSSFGSDGKAVFKIPAEFIQAQQ